MHSHKRARGFCGSSLPLLRWLRLFCWLVALASPVVCRAQAQAVPEPETDAASETTNSGAAAPVDAPAATEEEPIEATATPGEVRASPELLEDVVDQALRAANLPASGNTPTHFIVAGTLVFAALLLRSVIVRWLFAGLRVLVRRTPFELDDCLLPPLERTVRTLFLVLGVVAALKVLKLPPAIERALEIGYVIAFSLVALAFLLRLADALLDRLQARAQQRGLTVVAFMPWIKRIVLASVFVCGVLMVAGSLGADVRAFLAGLGIGGLAVALAAQDTLANIFGSVVIAADQPFRTGEFVQIGAHAGSVEDIGLRSTRLRTAQKNLISIPNKTVAAETIVNLTRFIGRRVEQTFRLTYDATPEQMAALVEDIRGIVLGEEDVDQTSVIVQFTDLSPSSLDIWLAYNFFDPDFVRHLQAKQRINLEIMRAVARRGMRFAHPTQSVHVESLPERESIAPPAGRRDG